MVSTPLWQAVSGARGTVRSPSERAHAPTTPRRRRAAALLIVVRRSNARSGRSFAFKAIISKRVDYRSPADEASTPAAASLTRRTRSTAVAARSGDRCIRPAKRNTARRHDPRVSLTDVNQQRRLRRPGACRAWTVTPSARSCSLTARRPRSAEQQPGIATPHCRVRPAEVVTSASTGSALRGTESPTRAFTPVIGCPHSDH